MTAAWLGLAAQGTQSTHWFRDPKCHAHSHRGLASEGAPPRPHGLDECSQSPRRQHNPEEEAFGLNQNRDMSPSPQVPRKERRDPGDQAPPSGLSRSLSSSGPC